MKLPLHLLQPVLSTSAMQWADRETIESLGIPGRVLMETAGRAVADAATGHLGPPAGKRIVVLCGRGNNGGDGFVVARLLRERGCIVRTIVAGSDEGISGDAAANLTLLRALETDDPGLTVEVLADADGLNAFWPECIVDALLGVGVSGPLRQPIEAFARWANQSPAPTISVDVPTGLNADSGEAAADTVDAVLTVTVAALKRGLLWKDGPERSGNIEVVDIGIPRRVLSEAVRQPGSAWRTSDSAVRAVLPRRPHDVHKYSAGRVLVIAGSLEFPGAAVMTGLAAARMGAGAVTVAAPQRARAMIAHHLTEVMSIPLPETGNGSAAIGALELLLQQASAADAVVLGPGMSREAETQELIRELVLRIDAPMVIDADGLNGLAGHTDLLRGAGQRQRILTPHLGELRRLAGDVEISPDDRPSLALKLAQQFGSVLIVKGMPSVVASPAGDVVIAGPTTSALATAGTGDVLAGMTASLLAQGLDPIDASAAALHLGGRAAQRLAARGAARTMVATDLLSELGRGQ